MSVDESRSTAADYVGRHRLELLIMDEHRTVMSITYTYCNRPYVHRNTEDENAICAESVPDDASTRYITMITQHDQFTSVVGFEMGQWICCTCRGNTQKWVRNPISGLPMCRCDYWTMHTAPTARSPRARCTGTRTDLLPQVAQRGAEAIEGELQGDADSTTSHNEELVREGVRGSARRPRFTYLQSSEMREDLANQGRARVRGPGRHLEKGVFMYNISRMYDELVGSEHRGIIDAISELSHRYVDP
ncbi:hypothetical protein DL768_002057 [Monosporascus sp. mg162]|nr:hypothetical protein DL768_002057 [Monosporascus sp. mg162]